MINPLKKSGLFATPKDMKALEAYVEMLPPQDRVMAWILSGMTWNLASQTLEDGYY